MVEVHLKEDLSPFLLVLFAICTTLVVAIHLIALFISTCILPHIEGVSGDQYDQDSKESTNQLRHSPHVRLRWYIELAWVLSTGVGILLFLVQMSVLTWVRFLGVRVEAADRVDSKGSFTTVAADESNSSFTASIVATAVMVPAIIVFIIFAVHFYRQLIAHNYERVANDINELENAVLELELVSGCRPNSESDIV